MKNPARIGLVALIAVSACTHRARVTMNAIRPADITLSSEIKAILLLDRTEFDKNNALSILEGIATGELPGEDKAAVQRALSGLNAKFQTSDRFVANIAQERLKGNSLTSAFPAQLPWDEIDALCKKYDTQAILAIEMFDSDFVITRGSRKKKKTEGEGESKREIEVEEFYANGVANVTMGIRLYDGLNHSIVDEQFFKQTNTWEEVANSTSEALAKLIIKTDATSQLCAHIAEDYAYRVTPLPIEINRMFYRKHKKAPAIETGARLADVNQWSEALNVWKNGIPTADRKRAGYLSYNAAIANEVLGDLESAIKYAQDAYITYGNNEARSYVSQLNARKADMLRLEEQQ